MQRFVQLALDLLAPAPPDSDQPLLQSLPPPPRSDKNPSETLYPQGKIATENIANTASAPLAQLLTPTQFRHPCANREVRWPHAVVAYEFKRAKRRTIGFVVGPRGLEVRAPKWVTLAQLDAALQEKSSWIVRKLAQTHERQQQLEAARVHWQEGASFPFLGDPVRVVLDPGHDFGAVGAQLRRNAQASGPSGPEQPSLPGLCLCLSLPRSANTEQIRDAVQAWLMRQARQLFTERLDHFAPRLGVRWRKLSLSSANTRWGSASADGAIRLNWRLIHFRPEVIDYVVAHELSHLRVMDHSPRFWDTVRSVLPDYQHLRAQLRDDTLPRWQ